MASLETTPTRQPPSALSPVLAGLLVADKPSVALLTAFVVEMGERGQLSVIKKGGHFQLTRRTLGNEHLQSWEEELLDWLVAEFGGQRSQANPQQIFANCYQTLIKLGLLKEPPELARRRHRIAAVGSTLLAVVGLAGIVVVHQSSWLVVFIISLIGGLYGANRLAVGRSGYSANGWQERQRWQSFAGSLTSQNIAGKYVAYAVAFGQTEKIPTQARCPDWLVSYNETTENQLAQDLAALESAIKSRL